MADWGIKVSESGSDVKTAADVNLLISSKFPMFKISAQGTANLKMYKTTISDGADGINDTQTTIGVASTTGFPSASLSDPKFIWVQGDGFDWEGISYTGKTSTSFTGCTRGYKALFGNQVAANGNTVVNGYNETTVDSGFSYPPVHFVMRDDGTGSLGTMLPQYYSSLGTDLADAWVDSDNDLHIAVNYGVGDFNFEAIVPSGTYEDYNFVYTICIESILTPYY